MPCPNALHAHPNQPRTVRCGAANPDRPRLNLNRRTRISPALAPQTHSEIKRCIFPPHSAGSDAYNSHAQALVAAVLFSSFQSPGPSPRKRPRKGPKGTFHGTLHRISHRKGRRPHHLLPRSRPERCANPSPPARTPLFIANVRASLRPPFRSLPSHRARLSGLRPQRLARPEKIRVHLRSHRRRDESFHRSARPHRATRSTCRTTAAPSAFA